MPTFWQLTLEQQRFAVEHMEHPVLLAQWRGELFYRVERTNYRQAVDFSVAAQPTLNKTVISVEGPHLELALVFNSEPQV